MAGSVALRGDIVDVQRKSVTISASRWLVGAYDFRLPNETTPVNPSSPPAGLLDLGYTMEDFQLQMKTSLFRFESGVPKTLKKLLVIDRDLSLVLKLCEFSPANVSRAVYDSANPLKHFAATPPIFQAPNNVSGSTLNVGTESRFAVNDRIALGNTSAELISTDQDYLITAITFSTPNYTLQFDRGVSASFASNPWIGKIASYKVPFATGRACTFALYGVCDDIEGQQRVICIPRAVVTSGMEGSLPLEKSNLIFQMNIAANAFTDSDTNDSAVAVMLRFGVRGY